MLAARRMMAVAKSTIFDNFDGTDHSSLGLTSDGKATWTIHAGTWERLTNQAHASVAVGAGAVASIDCGTPDGTLQATLGTSQVAIAFRVVDATHFYVAYINSVWRCVAGTFASLGASSAVAGVPMSVVLAGSAIDVYQSGSHVFSATDSTFSTNRHGIFSQRTLTTDLINDWSWTSP